MALAVVLIVWAMTIVVTCSTSFPFIFFPFISSPHTSLVCFLETALQLADCLYYAIEQSVTEEEAIKSILVCAYRTKIYFNFVSSGSVEMHTMAVIPF